MPTEEASNIAVTLAVAAAAVVVAYILGTVVSIVVRRAGRRSEFVRDVSHRMRRPLRAVLVVLALLVALRTTTSDADRWTVGTEHWLLIVGIGVGAWFVGALAFVIEDSVLKKFRTDVVDNRHARRIRTQVVVVRRVTVALVVICAIAAMLFTFPAARTAGTSLLASAGLISIVAGLAAQSALGNVFAGMQIAFTDAIRVDDVVVLEGEWGRIEEITMTYVVVHLWDDRRLIMPCTYFTTTPFQNWTRRAAELLGTVEIDLDWEVPVPEMRAELKRLLEASPLWDKRVGILQVTDATNGLVRMRALASAADAGTLFDLRCYVREGLVDWLQRSAPQGMPHTRLSTNDGRVGAALDSVAGTSPSLDLAKSPVRSGVLDSLFDEQRYGAESDKPSITSEPDLPRRIAVRSSRPGVRMHLSEPARGIHAEPESQPSEDKTTVMGPVGTSAAPTTPTPPAPTTGAPEPSADSTMAWGTSEGLFTGSDAAVERSKAFSGPGQEVIDERERTALLDAVVDDADDTADSAGRSESSESRDSEKAPPVRRHAGHEAAGSTAPAVPAPAVPAPSVPVPVPSVPEPVATEAEHAPAVPPPPPVEDVRPAHAEVLPVAQARPAEGIETDTESETDLPAAPVEAPAVEPDAEDKPTVTRTGVLRRSARPVDRATTPPEETARMPRVVGGDPREERSREESSHEQTTRIPRLPQDGEEPPAADED